MASVSNPGASPNFQIVFLRSESEVDAGCSRILRFPITGGVGLADCSSSFEIYDVTVISQQI